MPYITQERRKAIDLAYHDPVTIGEVNYFIIKTCLAYWEFHQSYQGINDIIGVLECAKQEFYRRVAAPYEDKKIKENGDVYL